MEKGLVLRTTGSWYRVLPEGASLSDVVDCRLRGGYRLRGNKQTNPVAVGDRVAFELQADGTGVINDVADRSNYIVRRATKLSKQTHVIAANIDLLCVVASMSTPRTSTGFIDRLLVTAEAYHIPVLLVLNKSDLCASSADHAALQEQVREIYDGVGYPVCEVSALCGQGLDELREELRGKVVLFAGHSGVGKSALLNAIEPGLQLRVGEVSEWTQKGMHTTTFAELHRIEGLDAWLIDTPGVKEFGLVDFKPEELSHFFPEMRSRLHGCRFANCTHRHEPGCAVKEALAAGEIPEERYKNYLKMIED